MNKLNNIDFGVVEKYISDRGFGFVNRTFSSESQSEVFFHIKSLKKSHPNLAKNLDDENKQDIYFWYELEKSEKGEQVSRVLERGSIQQLIPAPHMEEKIFGIWLLDISRDLPTWINDVTVDLFGDFGLNELSKKRGELQAKRALDLEKKRKEQEVQRMIWVEKSRKVLEAKNVQRQIKDGEFERLVAEIKHYGFTSSSEVSKYIVRNNLGLKYQHISGIVEMEANGTSWNFKGGFPSEIYAELCSELGLKSRGSSARVVGFTSFKEL